MYTDEQARKVKLQIYPNGYSEHGFPNDTVLTCDSCQSNDSCEFAFDLYNTDGDCLDSK